VSGWRRPGARPRLPDLATALLDAVDRDRGSAHFDLSNLPNIDPIAVAIALDAIRAHVGGFSTATKGQDDAA
jgi:hypothetical protein